MGLSILSLNIRVWKRDTSPFDWNRWWIVRTWRQRKYFKEEAPDVICLQERAFPIGKFFLGLKGYKCYGGIKCPVPIYVKKSIQCVFREMKMLDHNGHGYNTVSILDKEQRFDIINVHLPYSGAVMYAPLKNGVICGDFNTILPAVKKLFASNITSIRERMGLDVIDTFQNYKHPEQHGEIDHFIISENLTAVPKYYKIGTEQYKKWALSDHEPIIVKF